MIFKHTTPFFILIIFCNIGCKDKENMPSPNKSETIIKQTWPVYEPKNTAWISCIESSKDGKLLLIGTGMTRKAKPKGYPGKVYIFNAETNKLRTIINTHQYPIASIGISIDAKIVASGDNQGNLFLTDMADNTSTSVTIDQENTSINCLKYSPDGRTLYAAKDKSVSCIDTHSNHVVDKYETNMLVFSFDFNPEFKKIAMGGGYGVEKQKLIQVWNIPSKQFLQEYFDGNQFDEDEIRGVYFLSANTCVVRGALSAYLINLLDGNCERIYTTSDEHVSGGELTGLAISSDGKQIALCGYDVLGVFNTETNKFLTIEIPFNTHMACQVCFVGRNNDLFVGQESKIYIWRSESNKLELWYDLFNP